MARQRKPSSTENVTNTYDDPDPFSQTAESLLIEEDEEDLQPVQVVIKKKTAKKSAVNPRARQSIIDNNADHHRVAPARTNKRRMSGPPAICMTEEEEPSLPRTVATSVVENAAAAAINSQSPPDTAKKRKKFNDVDRKLSISPEIVPRSYDSNPPPMVDKEVESITEDECLGGPEPQKNPPGVLHNGLTRQVPPLALTPTPGPGTKPLLQEPTAKAVRFEDLVENHDEIPKSSISK